MTESQIKQFAVQSEELKRRCDELSKLNASIAQTISSYDKTGQFKLTSLHSLVTDLDNIDQVGIKDLIVGYAKEVQSNLQTDIDSISLLSILSEIEKVQ